MSGNSKCLNCGQVVPDSGRSIHVCPKAPYRRRSTSEKHCATKKLVGFVGRIHELKTWPEYFDPILCGDKRFEGRRDDRNFAVGDWLRLREWSPESQQYTGREVTVVITFKLQGGQFGVDKDWCVLSFRNPIID